jgi:hypothetical protein
MVPQRRAVNYEDIPEVVDLLYQAILRRQPDTSGRKAYISHLESGMRLNDVIKTILVSAEFQGKALLPLNNIKSIKFEYSIDTDPVLQKYNTPEFIYFSEMIKQDPKRFDETFDKTGSLAMEQLALSAHLGGQADYFVYHKKRFLELNNIISNILTFRHFEEPSILDVGVSINSFITNILFPNAQVSVSDRPQISLKPDCPLPFFPVDLASHGIDSLELKQLFDIIVFAEVIEHLLCNPIRVFSFLIRHLTDEGYLIITTPNFFSLKNLDLIQRRFNPQPIYPAKYTAQDAPHFHVREYCLNELLQMAEKAGGIPVGFFFSACWDDDQLCNNLPHELRGNLCIVVRRLKR